MKTLKWLSLFVLVVIVGVVFLPDVEADQTWTQCAAQNGTCTFTGERVVRYGTVRQNRTKKATTSIACTTAQFGRDPAVGQVKNCWYAGAAPPPPSGGIAGAPTLTPSGPVHTNFAMLVNVAGTVIDGHTFNGSGSQVGFPTCMYVTADNVTIRNSVFRNCLSSAINPEAVSNLLIENNTFIDSQTAVYVQAPGDFIVTQYNLCINSDGESLGVACVKYNGVGSGGVGRIGNKIKGNVAIQDQGVGNTEDVISIYNSSGVSGNPLMIEDNCVQGANNTSSTGTAYNFGDYTSNWLHARNNTYINVNGGGGSFSGGGGINGGHNNIVENHRVYCRGVNTGQQQWCQTAIWDYYGQGCTNITITGTLADVRDASGTRISAFQDLGGCNTGLSMTNNDFLATLAQPVCVHGPRP